MSDRIASPTGPGAARVVGAACAALGVAVLAGWALDVGWIKRVLPGAVDMKANTALGLFLAGAALSVVNTAATDVRTRIAQALGLAVAALGFATLSQFAFGWSLGIDELLVRDNGEFYTAIPGRMSPYAAAAFACVGLGISAIPVRAMRGVAFFGGFSALVLGGAAFVGYLWNASELVTDRYAAPMAIHTAAAFIAIGCGLLSVERSNREMAGGPGPAYTLVERRTILAFAATVVLLLACGGLAYRSSVREAESAALVRHTLEVRASLGTLYGAVSDAESQQRNFLLGGDHGHLEESGRRSEDARDELGKLAILVGDDKEQSGRLAGLRGAVEQRLAVLDETTAEFNKAGLGAAQGTIRRGEGVRLMMEIRSFIALMDATEAGLLAARASETARSKAITLVALLGALLISLAGFLVLFRQIRREIRDRARAEAELDRFFTLSLDFLCIASADGYFKRVSPAVADMLGWSVDEFLRTPYIELVHPDDRPATLREVARQVLSGEKVLRFDNRYRHKDGSWRLLSWRSVPQPGGLMYATARDITELKRTEEALRESEARYRTLFNSIDEGFCIIEMIRNDQGAAVDYRFLETNASFEAHTGIENAVGRRMREFSPEFESHWLEALGAIASTGRPRRFQNRAEQLHRTFDVYAFRFGRPGDDQVAVLFSDITAREAAAREVERLNEDLRRQTEQLATANKELEAFSYSVSHDLRAPLRHVQGYVDMLTRDAQDVLPEKSRRFLRTIFEAARDMGRLIDDLLAFSRMGRAEMREDAVDLNALVGEVRAELEPPAGERDIRWDVQSLPAVRGDRAMLKQVLVNLLGNAVKYTRDRDPACIEIGGRQDGNGEIQLYVRDNGAGFDMQYADKLFGVFQRLHRTDEFEGTGIGLASVRRIVARHGGRTWAEGRVGEGATFHFTLPAAADAVPAHTES